MSYILYKTSNNEKIVKNQYSNYSLKNTFTVTEALTTVKTNYFKQMGNE